MLTQLCSLAVLVGIAWMQATLWCVWSVQRGHLEWIVYCSIQQGPEALCLPCSYLLQPPINTMAWCKKDAGRVCSYPTRPGLLILTRLVCVLLLLVLTGVPQAACGSGPAGMVFAAGAPLGISGIKSTARLEADRLYR